MTGIMTAVAGNAQNIIYVSGLRIVENGTVQQSPITANTSTSGSQSITRNWIGYFLSPFTGPVTLSVQTTAGATGGFTTSASTTGRLWLGNNAEDGNDAQANITASGNQTINSSFNLSAGVYYPLRIRWNGSYQGSAFNNAFGSITFLVSGSDNVSGRIFYNSLTNGF